jgi:hypothetical protein
MYLEKESLKRKMIDETRVGITKKLTQIGR